MIVSEDIILYKTRKQIIWRLSYKPEGRGLDSRRSNWNFLLT